MRVADYIFRFLADRGASHVFLVTGGGAMHLDDAIRCEKRLSPVCCHHEQACAIGAEGYVRAGGGLGVVCVTSGPGGTNTMTGLIGQWLDSIPVIYISGQVKFETTIGCCPELKLRQLGDQEINIVDLVRPVTKYAALVTDPLKIREELEKALFHAFDGRPGPVWLDIPLNVQGAPVEMADLAGFSPLPAEKPAPAADDLDRLVKLLRHSERPVIIGGFGVRLAGACAALSRLAGQWRIPVVTTFNGFDLIADDHPQFAGRIGTLGQRAGNFVLQNADLVLSIGSRNNMRQVSYDWKNYARAAVKISVDIDPAELAKKTFVPDLPICADAGAFLASLEVRLAGESDLPRWDAWNRWCRERRERHPAHTPEQLGWTDRINPYHFMHELTRSLPPEATVVAGNGTACVALFQTGIVKAGQRQFWNSGCASMGYDLPAAVGAAIAGKGRLTVCLAGDGSLMMNLQELQTLVRQRLPVKIFLLDNNGYSSIKQTQSNFFGPELIGCDDASGVSFPDFLKVAEAFGLPTFELSGHCGLAERIAGVLESPGPAFCRVLLPDHFVFSPKLASKKLPDGRMVSSPLEDMYPFLEREELRRNMIIASPDEG